MSVLTLLDTHVEEAGTAETTQNFKLSIEIFYVESGGLFKTGDQNWLITILNTYNTILP